VGHAIDVNVDIVSETTTLPFAPTRPASGLHPVPENARAGAPLYLFADTAYLDAEAPSDTPCDLAKHASLFMMRTEISPNWRLRHSARREREVVEPLTPRLLVDDMVSLKEAAIAALVALLPGYVCRDEVRAGVPRQVLPGWTASD